MNDKLKKIYDNPNIGLGLGIVSFYKIVKDKYIGIKRDDVEKFLKVRPITNWPKNHSAKLINLLSQHIRSKMGIDKAKMQFYGK